jgi:hypothetical protein
LGIPGCCSHEKGTVACDRGDGLGHNGEHEDKPDEWFPDKFLSSFKLILLTITITINSLLKLYIVICHKLKSQTNI